MKNQFLKSSIAFWGMIFVIVLNLAILLTYLMVARTDRTAQQQDCQQANSGSNAMVDELGLTPDQKTKVLSINENYRMTAEPVASEIREKRGLILAELEADQPDTLKIKGFIDTIAMLQTRIQTKNIQQYLALKQVCTPEQALRLSTLYRNIYGCPMKENKMQNRHKHRHGQGKSDSGRSD